MSPPLSIPDVKDDEDISSNSSSSPTIHNDEPQAVRRKPVVQFGHVEVRIHERLLGDNPGSHEGPSITCGWKYNCSEAVSVDAWETQGEEQQEEPSSVQRRKPRRSRPELFLSAAQRVQILQNIGYSTAAIGRNAQYVKQCQEERKATLLEYQQQQQKEKELQKENEEKEEARLQEIAEKSCKREQLGSKKPNMCQHNPTRARLSTLDTAEGKTLRS